MSYSLDQKYKNKIVAVLAALFPQAKIILYGSRARMDNQEKSDIDIAIDAGKELARVDIGEARDMLNESSIPYKIDVVDYWSVSQAMRDAIIKDGIKLKICKEIST